MYLKAGHVREGRGAAAVRRGAPGGRGRGLRGLPGGSGPEFESGDGRDGGLSGGGHRPGGAALRPAVLRGGGGQQPLRLAAAPAAGGERGRPGEKGPQGQGKGKSLILIVHRAHHLKPPRTLHAGFTL